MLLPRAQAAQSAIAKYNGSELHGRQLSVGLDRKLQQQEG